MPSSIASRTAIALLLVSSLAISGCSKHPEKGNVSKPAAEAPSPSGSAGIGEEKSRIFAVAEPFELLTEAAGGGDRQKVEAAAGTALTSGAGILNILPSTSKNDLESQMAAIKRGQQAKDLTTIAIASNEAYRILVSASAGAANFPVEVSLLDYAGFRYDANLKAKPARWADMTEATAFAERQWALVEPKLNQPPLAAEFTKALAGMKKAAETKNSTLAAESVKAELGLVDKLETALGKSPKM